MNRYIKFWGVRGSNPTADKNKMLFGGDTSCVEIRTNDNDCIILDMGTGLRKLGNHILSDSSYKKEINILLSHYHWDHIMGFFYFAPLNNKEYTINIALIQNGDPTIGIIAHPPSKKIWFALKNNIFIKSLN